MDTELIGYIAGTLTTFCFIPQAWKIIRENNISGVSLPMYIIFSCGVACWLAYGLCLANNPVIIFNLLTLCLTVTIILKLVRLKNA